MKSKRLPLWLGAIGTVLLLPGIVWVAGARGRLSDADAGVALQPLKRIGLNRIDRGPSSAALMIPNTGQWAKIRKLWGEPDFVISAVDTTGLSVLCLPEMAVRIELIDPKDKSIPLQPERAPYGYSDDCALSSLRFHGRPGSELKLKLTPTRRGTIRPGDLIVVSDWFNTKDKLVGLNIDKSIETLLKWLSVTGVLAVVSGAGVFIVNAFRHPEIRKQG